MFIGNIFVYFQFQDKDLDLSTINVVFIVMSVVSAVGVGFLFTLRPPKIEVNDSTGQPNNSEKEKKSGVEALKKSFKLFATKEMLLLVVTFFYTGEILQKKFSNGFPKLKEKKLRNGN